MLSLFENPVFLREALPKWWRRTARPIRAVFIIGYLALLAGMAVLVYVGLSLVPDWLTVFPWPAFAMLTTYKGWPLRLIVLASAALCIAEERERRTWDTLVLTRLTPNDTLLAKWAARWTLPLALLLPMLAFEGALVAATLRTGEHQSLLLMGNAEPFRVAPLFDALLINGMQIPFLLACSMVGLYCSLRSRRTADAVVKAFVGAALLWAGNVVIMLVVAVAGQGAGSTPIFVIFGAATVPLPLFVTGVLWSQMRVNFLEWDRCQRGGKPRDEPAQPAYELRELTGEYQRSEGTAIW